MSSNFNMTGNHDAEDNNTGTRVSSRFNSLLRKAVPLAKEIAQVSYEVMRNAQQIKNDFTL
jgi:hypothetical protein